jgi:hypothetical protein
LVGLEIKALILLHVFMRCDSYYLCADFLTCQQIDSCVLTSDTPTVYGSGNSNVACLGGVPPENTNAWGSYCYVKGNTFF